MALPSITKLQELTRACVLKSDKEEKLHTLTPKLLRRDLEKKLELKEGDLDTVECRDAVKKAIQSAMAELESGQGNQEEKEEQKDKKPKTQTDSPKVKKRKLNPKTGDNGTKPASDGARTKKRAEGKGKGPVEGSISPSNVKTNRKNESTKPKKPTKRSKVAQARIAESTGEQGQRPSQGPASKTAHAETASSDTLNPQSNAATSLTLGSKSQKKDTLHHESESELSALTDEPPKRKRKAKAEKNGDEPGKQRKPRSKSSGSISKDDETIKKLKSLVLACGVRKVWSRVFQGLDSPSQQIGKLKEILQELGMTGRMNMEQAKAIKAKRELEQELQDVKDFEKSIMGPDPKKEESEGEVSAGADDDGDGDDPKLVKKRMNARQSIMAFLGDQSSDDD